MDIFFLGHNKIIVVCKEQLTGRKIVQYVIVRGSFEEKLNKLNTCKL